MNVEELKEILGKHKKWLNQEKGGERADLSGADLSGADIDYSCWPLSCKSLNVKVDKRIGVQLLYHAINALKSVDDEEVKAVLADEKLLALANKFHRVDECGRL